MYVCSRVSICTCNDSSEWWSCILLLHDVLRIGCENRGRIYDIEVNVAVSHANFNGLRSIYRFVAEQCKCALIVYNCMFRLMCVALACVV